MSEENIKRKVLKLAILGDSAVGKTSICRIFFDYEFDQNQLSTIGQAKFETTIKIEDKKKMKLIIWDTAGQERFHAMAIKACKNAQGIIVTFDLTQKETFKNVQNWLNEIYENFDNIPIMLIGNKCDIVEGRQIDEKDARDFAKKNNFLYYETSAKENKNIKEGIMEFANIVYKKYRRNTGFSLEEGKNNKPKRGCCGGEKVKNEKKEKD